MKHYLTKIKALGKKHVALGDFETAKILRNLVRAINKIEDVEEDYSSKIMKNDIQPKNSKKKQEVLAPNKKEVSANLGNNKLKQKKEKIDKIKEQRDAAINNADILDNADIAPLSDETRMSLPADHKSYNAYEVDDALAKEINNMIFNNNELKKEESAIAPEKELHKEKVIEKEKKITPRATAKTKIINKKQSTAKTKLNNKRGRPSTQKK